MELNGIDLDNIDDVLSAFGRLHYQNETEFTLEVMRGSTPVTINYEVVP